MKVISPHCVTVKVLRLNPASLLVQGDSGVVLNSLLQLTWEH